MMQLGLVAMDPGQPLEPDLIGAKETIDMLESGLGKLSKRREVVAYCRGPYCLMSLEAVLKLRRRGWKARRMQHGFPEWKAAGMPVESLG